MNYRETERQRIQGVFQQGVNGMYGGCLYPFVLKDPKENLWKDICKEALNYFKGLQITWHKGEEGMPTGHLLSSQVACINHLFVVRKDKALATALLKGIDPQIEEAESIVEKDGGYRTEGYVAFEYIGTCEDGKNKLGERAATRGSQCTSVDATMIGRYADGKRVLVFIEWKYTEQYSPQDLYIPRRADVYDAGIVANDSPFKPIDDVSSYYYEPFYQMMRQTLLAHGCVKAGERGCTDYYHVHVIPEANRDLHENITSEGLSEMGSTLKEVWQQVLKQPEKYISKTPQELVQPLQACDGTDAWMNYLKWRYA